jgi:ribosome-associated protein
MTATDPTPDRLGRDAPAALEAELDALDVAQVAAHLAENKKGERTTIFDVRGKCSYADYFVVTGGPSERQAQAIARSIDDGLRRGGVKPISVEGMREGAWVLIDFGDVVVHCFQSSARDYYDLDGFWSDAPKVEGNEASAIETLKGLGLDQWGEKLAD